MLSALDFLPGFPPWRRTRMVAGWQCEDRVLDGLASGGKGANGRNSLDCIRGKGQRKASPIGTTCGTALAVAKPAALQKGGRAVIVQG